MSSPSSRAFIRLLGRRTRQYDERGSALVDFALVSVVLVPMVFAILQIAFIWHVRTTLTSAASEGARFGAVYTNTPADGRQRTADVIDKTFGREFVAQVEASRTDLAGQPVVTVMVSAQVPVLAFWGPTVQVQVQGHAIQEVLP